MDPIRTAVSLLWLSVCVGVQCDASDAPGNNGPPVSRHPAERSAEPGRTMTMTTYRRDPSVNGTVVLLHDYMVFLYRTFSRLQRKGNYSVSRDATGFANTVTGFVDQGKDQASWRSGQHYVFDLSSLPETDRLVEVELRILRTRPADLLPALTTGGNLYDVLLYACSPEGSSGRRQLLDSRTVEVLDGGLPRWEVFDVWAGVEAHRRSHGGRVCFHLLAVSELTGEAADPSALGLVRHGRPHQEKALLVAFSHADRNDNLFMEIREKMKTAARSFGFPRPLQLSRNVAVRQGKRRRHRRTALSNRSFGTTGGGAIGGGGGVSGGGKGGAGRRRTRCNRKPLHVNFKDLGWDDWIIAPLDYEAHHCEGVCDFPLRSHLEPTNHAIIQTLMNSMDPDASPPSCCVPAKLSPISILYIDSGNNVVYKQYEDMVVESCGCR